MRFAIVKCHGSGNDFPMIDARGIELAPGEWATVARALADRRGAVGGDGLLLLNEGQDGCQLSMVMRNSDGSEAETCLNGLRCVARMGFEALEIDRAEVALKVSRAMVERVADLAPGVYTVLETAGPATLDVERWPMLGEAGPLIERRIAGLPTERRFTAVAMPNPHLVAFVEAVDEAELMRVGAVCEAAPDWLPNRANVSFVVADGDGLFVRTFERGVGLTDSCGSAMGASVYAAGLTGRIGWDREITVRNRGGMVRAAASEDAMVRIAGNATYEWRGSVEVDLASGVAGELVIDHHYNDEIAAWSVVAEDAAGQ